MKFGKLFNAPFGVSLGIQLKRNEIDFEGNGSGSGSSNDTDQNNNNNDDDNRADLDNNGTGSKDLDNQGNQNQDNNNNNDNNNDNDNDNNNEDNVELHEGDELNVDGVIYTVNANGDVVDANGNVFKSKDEIQDWLKEQNVNDNNDDGEIDINNIIEAVGINITDEEGNNVEFTNDAQGVKAYIDNVMELRSKEIADATINRLFDEAPIVKEFIDYLKVNGSPRGFGEIRDLSGVKLDKENENQQIAVIRAAAEEFGNTTLSESYIKYLKDSGGLYDEANKQLQAMIARDNAAKEERARQAREADEAEQERVNNYWNQVNETIKERNIAGYKIPESFTIENNGQKVIVTPDDFWAYLTIRDKETGLSEYQRDLQAMSEKDIMDNELLDAWLHFTGRTYKDLINMELKKEQVRQLKISSKNNQARGSVQIRRKSSGTTDINSIILG